MGLKKPDCSGKSTTLSTGSATGLSLSTCACLMEALTADAYEDGAKRQRGALRIAVEGSSWSLSLTDPTTASSVYTTAGTLPEALQAMEDGLATGQAVWRKWRQGRK